MRLLLARWREAHGGEQYVGDGDDWWGSGDVAADEFEDVCSLTSPLDSDAPLGGGVELPEGSHLGRSGGALALEDALLEMAKQARWFLDAHTRVAHELAALLMGQLCSNSLTLYAPDGAPGGGGGETGVAVSASVAMLNHSCDPSADWAVDADGCLVVTAIAPIAAGDEIFISYVDPRLPSATRRRKLRENFFFECDCTACREGVVAAAWCPKAKRRRANPELPK
jgi:SET and MYND domain-containing protein